MNVNSNTQFWITWNAEKNRLLLPVNPEEVKISNQTKVDTVNTANGNPQAVPTKVELQKIDFSSFFPKEYCQGCVVDYNLRKPREYVVKIMQLANNKTPVHFFITGRELWSPRNTSMYLISKFDYSEKGGDPETLEYSITLVEYPAVTLQKVKISNNKVIKQTKQTRVFNSTKNKIYIVKKGDTLVSLCMKNYGNASKDTINAVVRENSYTMPNSDCIYEGLALMLPQIIKRNK